MGNTIFIVSVRKKTEQRMRTFVKTISMSLLGLSLLGGEALAEPLYNAQRSSVMNLNPKNFEK